MKLKKIYTEHFPKKGFTALTIIPFVFVRKDRMCYFTAKAERHETTHALQQIELCVVGLVLAIASLIGGFGLWSLLFLPLFFWLYGLEWLIKLPFCKFDTLRAYMSISTEQEAYEHQQEVYYNEVRKHFAWLRYVFTLNDYRHE